MPKAPYNYKFQQALELTRALKAHRNLPDYKLKARAQTNYLNKLKARALILKNASVDASLAALFVYIGACF